MKQYFSFLLAFALTGATATLLAQTTEVEVTPEASDNEDGTPTNPQVLILNSGDGRTVTIIKNGETKIGSISPIVTPDQISESSNPSIPSVPMISYGLGNGNAAAISMTVPSPSFFAPCGGSFLGVYGDEVTKELVEKLNLPGEYGAHIVEVTEGSGAEKAGLLKEDVIVGYNSYKVESMTQLRRLVAETPMGRKVSLTIIRNGVEQQVEAEIGSRPGMDLDYLKEMEMANFDSTTMMNFLNNDGKWEFFPEEAEEKMKERLEELELRLEKMPDLSQMKWEEMQNNMPRVFTRMTVNDGRKLGVTAQSLTPQLGQFFKLDEGQKGVLITEVHQGFPAKAADMRAGDVIVDIEGEMVANPFDISRIIADKEGKIEVHIIREGRPERIYVDLGAKGADQNDVREDSWFYSEPQHEDNMFLNNN